jgi:rhodanese-related sulfurtransferase
MQVSGLKSFSPAEVQRLMASGEVLLVDIREPAEYAREHIPGALSAPLHRLDAVLAQADMPKGGQVVFHCQSGARTVANADVLAASARDWPAAVLEGGLSAWKAMGYGTRIDRTQPIDLMRQVQIAAGSLVLAGIGLGVFVHPWFLTLAAFVGAGLTFAGISGFCGMARLLACMPWNRPRPSGTPRLA